VAALGQLLLGAGAVTREQLTTALRQQVIYGARLGTNLLELGLVDHDQVAAALGRLHGAPAALASHLAGADPRARTRVPAALCAELVALPLGFAGDRLVVCMRDPGNSAEVATLARAAGAEVVAAACPELSLYSLLGHFYRVAAPARLAAASDVAGAVLRPLLDGSGADPVPLAVVEIDGAPALAVAAAPAPAPAPAPAAPDPDPAPAPLTLAGAVGQIALASHRDQIASAILGFLRQHFDAGMLLVVQGGAARGHLGFGGYFADGEAGEVIVPLEGRSPFRLAVDRRRRIRDPEAGDQPVLEAFLRRFPAPRWPASMVIEPIELRGRAVCLIYAHRIAGIPPELVWEQLSTLTAASADAFLRLIRTRRTSAAPEPG
jgi:hypothetical protein